MHEGQYSFSELKQKYKTTGLELRNRAPEKELDAEGALGCVTPVADFTHDPAAELVEPLHNVDNVRCNSILPNQLHFVLVSQAEEGGEER